MSVQADPAQLVTYPALAERPLGEDKMRFRKRVADSIFVVGFVFILVWLILGFVQGVSSSEFNEPAVAWSDYFGVLIITAFVLVMSFLIEDELGKTLWNIYKSVPQGMIVGMDTRGGDPLLWVIEVEGYNRLNQVRRQFHIVNAYDWHETYDIGDYVDFSKK